MSGVLLRNGHHAVLHRMLVSSRSFCPGISYHTTHRSVRDEVGELDDVARVCVDKRLAPQGLAVVPDLYNVRKGDGAIFLRDVFGFGRVPGVCAADLAFSLGDGISSRDRRDSRRHIGYGEKRLAK